MKGLTRFEKALTYFLPHPHTHQKAKLLSWHFLLIYLLLFILLKVSLDLVNIYRPGVLGVNSIITAQKIIEDTNKERQKLGLSLLQENPNLDRAAALKASNMFEENYWAHFSPSGQDPWGFITSSGYKFSYAGENLARNFYTAEDVVKAWMASPLHKENIVNKNYEDIGVAVVDGLLRGQKTTLVVQMFGKTYEPLASSPQINLGGNRIKLQSSQLTESQPITVAGVQNQVRRTVLDPIMIVRTSGVVLLSFIGTLLLADLVVLKKRGVFRLSSEHLAHFTLLALAGSVLVFSKMGEIL